MVLFNAYPKKLLNIHNKKSYLINFTRINYKILIIVNNYTNYSI